MVILQLLFGPQRVQWRIVSFQTSSIATRPVGKTTGFFYFNLTYKKTSSILNSLKFKENL